MNIYDVFLSYRRSDGMELARNLFEYLTEKGLRVFLDKEKMIGGQYFDEQIRQNIICAPNYIFVGTPDAFAFRKGETDYVAEEIKLAISEHDKAPTERVVLPVMTAGTRFPDKSDFPKGTEQLSRFDAVLLSGTEPTDTEYQKILRSVTAVNRRNLWNAGHRWLENSKKPGGRFASLDIDATIMPKADRRGKGEGFREMPINVFQKQKGSEGNESKTEDKPLLDALYDTQGHLYLIGQGGIGKTTALVSIMNDAYSGNTYSEEKLVPLFVELSRAPDTYGKLYEGGVSTFIRREIYHQIREDKTVKQVPRSGVGELDKVFGVLPYDAVVEPIDEELTRDTVKPEYLLLLDGLNETSRVDIEDANDHSVVSMIISEIQWIIDNCPNVRIVLTSRTDDSAMSGDKITRLYLSGIDNDTIRQYLTNRKLSKKRIEEAFADANLLETITVPLFLTMYASLENAEEVSSQGEIFRLFFSERRDNIGTYTTQGRAAEAEAGVTSQASSRRITSEMQSFILDFILPEIAWTMEREGAFYFDIDKIADTIEPVLTDDGIYSICGKYGKMIFSKYSEGEKKHTRSLAKKMLKKLGDDITEVAESMIDCAVSSLGIIQRSNDGYGFMHQHIRDYFAAVHEINRLRIADHIFCTGEEELAHDCLDSWKDYPINVEIRRFIGEYLEEDKNAPEYINKKWEYNVPSEKSDRNLIKNVLDIYRGSFDRQEGYTVYNLIEILKASRKNLSGADFHALDLRDCSFTGTVLGCVDFGADLQETQIDSTVLFPEGHSDAVSSAEFSHNGRYIVSSSWDKTVKVWDAKVYTLVTTLFGHDSVVTSASFSFDDNFIVTTSFDKTAKIWSTKDFKLIASLEGHTDYVYSAMFSPDGKYIVTASNDCTVRVWSASDHKQVKVIEGHTLSVSSVKFSPNGKRFITASDDGTVKIWDTDTYTLLATLSGHTDWIKVALYSSDGKRILTASDDKTIKIWNAQTYDLLASLEGHSDWIRTAAFSPDGKYIISGSWDASVKIWDAKNYSLIRTLDKDEWLINYCAYSPDGCYLVTSLYDNSIKIWDTKSYTLITSLDGNTAAVRSVSFSDNGQYLITSCNDKTAKIWDASNFALINVLQGHNWFVSSSEYCTELGLIVTTSWDGTAKIWNSDTFDLIRTVKDHSWVVNSAVISPDRKQLLTASWDSTAIVRDINDLSVTGVLRGHYHAVNYASYSADGRFIVTASDDNTAKVWDSETFVQLASLEGHTHSVTCSSCSPNGKYIATSSDDSTVRIWNASTFELVTILDGHTDDVNYVAFSPGDKYIITASDDKTIKIWTEADFLLVSTLQGHSGDVNFASISPDGKYIASVSSDGTCRIWDLDTFNCCAVIQNHYGLIPINCDMRNLHDDEGFTKEQLETLKIYGAKLD